MENNTEQATTGESTGNKVWVRRDDYKRPKRFCPYCSLEQTRLRRHLISKHREEPEVAAALQRPQNEQQAAFDRIKKDGIFQENKAAMKTDCPLKRDHQPAPGSTTKTKMCGQCKGFFSESYMWRHKLVCARNSNLTAGDLPIPTVSPSLLNTNEHGMEGTEFAKEVLPGLLYDEVGNICREDPTILVFGKHQWDKNVKEDKKPVRNAMRQLGHLVLECRKISSKSTFTGSDLFDRLNFETLTKALEKLTTGVEGGEKSSSKVAIVNTIKSASKTVKSTYLINDQLENATEIDRFRVVLDINWASIVNKATYRLQMRGQELLRQPKKLPLEEDVKRISDYIQEQLPIFDELDDMTLFQYNRLRAMLVTRLTLFNGRRGGECAQMSLLDWDKSERKVWTDCKTNLYPHEQALVDTFELVYFAGKGRLLVPVLVPKNCIPSIRKMVSLRETMAINPENKYLFPAGRNSKMHVPGNHAIAEVCKLAETIRPVTATEVRHSISTYYACQDLPAQERSRFYEHMGHSENINKNVYQAPLVTQELTMVGKHLLQYDAQLGQHSEARRGNEDQACMAVVSAPVGRDGTTNGADAEGSDRPVCDTSLGKRVSSRQKRKMENDNEYRPVDGEEDDESDGSPVKRKPKSSRPETTTSTEDHGRSFVRWTPDENRLIADYFGDWIQGRIIRAPGVHVIRNFMRIHDTGKSLDKLRTKINNEIKKARMIEEKRLKEVTM